MIDAYKKIKQKNDFEVRYLMPGTSYYLYPNVYVQIIFVSWDQHHEGWVGYMQQMMMPFVALDFEQRELAQLLAMKSDVDSIPRLLVLEIDLADSTLGKCEVKPLVRDGVSDIEQLGEGAYEKWWMQSSKDPNSEQQ